MTRTLATLVAACSLAAAGAASAQTIRVPFGDLDLASPADVQVFHSRVATAARTLCRPAAGAFVSLADRAGCERAVREDALRNLPSRAQARYALSRLPVVA